MKGTPREKEITAKLKQAGLTDAEISFLLEGVGQ